MLFAPFMVCKEFLRYAKYFRNVGKRLINATYEWYAKQNGSGVSDKNMVCIESLRSGISGSGGMQNILGMLENV